MDRPPIGTTLFNVGHVFFTLAVMVPYFVIARMVTHSWKRTAHSESVLRFLVEFTIVTIPTVMSVSVANAYVGFLSDVLTVCALVLVWKCRCIQKARYRQFEIGNRPTMLTLARSSGNFITAICILAVDFNSYPKSMRKDRYYGAGLMNIGIGFFVFTMGSVSRRPLRAAQFLKAMRIVGPLLVLGIARTLVIALIDYHQDEHEYGVHMNAFFTLGFTKLIGTFLSGGVSADVQLLPLGIGTLILHEVILQLGVSDFVMDKEMPRSTLWTANREGLCSLPGFVAMYLIAIYIGRWLQAESTLSYKEFLNKLKTLALVTGGLWLTTILSVFTVGIARVTCNFGYVAWVLAASLSHMLLFTIAFDFILDTLWPVQSPAHIEEAGAGDAELMMTKSSQSGDSSKFQIPSFAQALNMNGLTFFLLANVLTGGVNIFLQPEDRTSAESVFILTVYMFIATGVVYILYRLKIRIA